VRAWDCLWAGVAGAALVGAACTLTPVNHSTEPYRSDPEQARAIEQHAAQVCAERRGAEDLPPHPFKTDACSVWFDAGWKHCCVEHDVDYWCGGSAEDRSRSDRALRDCVAGEAGYVLPGMMHVGVRMGGAPWQPVPWRWGYGWDYYHAYDLEGDASPEVEPQDESPGNPTPAQRPMGSATADRS